MSKENSPREENDGEITEILAIESVEEEGENTDLEKIFKTTKDKKVDEHFQSNTKVIPFAKESVFVDLFEEKLKNSKGGFIEKFPAQYVSRNSKQKTNSSKQSAVSG